MNIHAVVVGHHRSGTSLLTAALHTALGLSLGRGFSDVVSEDNPKGYFEHPAFLAFNEQLQAHLGTSWDDWGFQASQFDFAGEAFASWRARAVSLVDEVFGETDRWIVKDPRFASLWPFWERVFAERGLSVSRILVLRDPREVGRSEAMRFSRCPHLHFTLADREAALAHWCVSLGNLLPAIQDDLLVIGHDDLYRDAAATVRRCAEYLGGDVDEAALDRFVTEFIDPDLWRARLEEEDETAGEEGWTALAMSLYRQLSPYAGRVVSPEDARSLMERNRELTAALSLLRPVSLAYRRFNEMKRAMDVKGGEREMKLYVAGVRAGVAVGYDERRSAFGSIYPLDGVRREMTLAFDGFDEIHALRLDPSDAPCAIVLHGLSLRNPDGGELWSWDGRWEGFRNPGGVFCWPEGQDMVLLCVNDDPQLELAIPLEALAFARGRAELTVRFTPRPLLEVLPSVVAQMQAKTAPDDLPELAVPVADHLSELAEIFKAKLEHKNEIIAAQRAEIESLYARQQALHEQLVRAEAQLELLKAWVLPGETGPLERL